MNDHEVARVERYKSAEGAARYNVLYGRSWAKRFATRQEFRVVERCFRITGPQDTMLDLPSGVGRLYPAYSANAKRFVAMDISLEMLKVARANTAARPTFAAASALRIPLRDQSVDLIFSARLFHHLEDLADRHRYIRELCRVSRTWIIMTFFDTWSLKNILRMVRRPFNRKRPKITMSTDEVRAVAAEAGWQMVDSIALSWIASGHRFAILRRKPSTP